MKSETEEILVVPIHQPYAWFYLNGYKDVENRTRKIADKWIGKKVAVFVSKTKLTQVAYQEFVAECEELGIKDYPPSKNDFPYGGIAGTFIVSAIVENSKFKWALRGYQQYLVKKPKNIPLRPMKGQRTPWRSRRFKSPKKIFLVGNNLRS